MSKYEKNAKPLLDGATANGDGSVSDWREGNNATFTAWGTWDGATVTVKASPDEGTTWIDLYSFTANGAIGSAENFDNVKATVSSAGASTSVSVSLHWGK